MMVVILISVRISQVNCLGNRILKSLGGGTGGIVQGDQK